MKGSPMRYIALVIALSFVLTLSGCLAVSVDDLFSLPQLSEEYLQLQELIDAEIAAGSEYSSPTSGNYRQSVQLYDIDGDGENEALAFFSTSDQVLRICIYCKTYDEYRLVSTIEGEGTSIGRIEYADLDGDGDTELIITWQVSGDLRLLRTYSFDGWNAAVLLTTDSSYFTTFDIDGDSILELLNIRFDVSGGGHLDMCSLSAEGEIETSTSRLSTGLTSIDAVRTGYLSDNVPALFVEGAYDNGILTDIFTVNAGVLGNITMNVTTQASSTYRKYTVYCTDIDNDRTMEIPSATSLYSQSESSATYWVFDWYSYTSSGRRSLDMSTYHCYTDGWYLVLVSALRNNLTVRRQDSSTVVMSTVKRSTGEVTDKVIIYTLTGENRHDRAKFDDRFILDEDDSTIYAAKLLTDTITQDEIINNFHIIYANWYPDAS